MVSNRGSRLTHSGKIESMECNHALSSYHKKIQRWFETNGQRHKWKQNSGIPMTLFCCYLDVLLATSFTVKFSILLLRHFKQSAHENIHIKYCNMTTQTQTVAPLGFLLWLHSLYFFDLTPSDNILFDKNKNGARQFQQMQCDWKLRMLLYKVVELLLNCDLEPTLYNAYSWHY